MNKNISLISCFNYVFTGFPYENLGSKGFVINHDWDRETEGVITQKLLLSSPAKNAVALEFLEIVDEVEFQKSFKKHNTVGQSSKEFLCSGLKFEDHENDEDKLKLIGSVPVSLLSKQKKMDVFPQNLSSHSEALNSHLIKSVWGIYLGLSPAEKERWSQFLGEPPGVENQWVLKDDCRILCATPDDGLYDYMESRKDFAFWAVVLQSVSWEDINKQIEFDKVFNWKGSPAGLIKQHITNWDIIIT